MDEKDFDKEELKIWIFEKIKELFDNSDESQESYAGRIKSIELAIDLLYGRRK